MPENANLETDFTVSGLRELLTGFRQAADAADAGADAADRLDAATEKLARTTRGTQGPYQRLIALQNELAHAVVTGTGARQQDIRLRLAQTEKQIERLTAPAKEAERHTTGPRQLARDLRAELTRADASGDSAHHGDVQDRLRQTERQIERQAAPAKEAHTMGPRQRAAELRTEIERARASGDSAYHGDVQDRLHQTEKQIRSHAPTSFEQKLLGVLRSSRFGIGGEGGHPLMPLVGQTLDLFKGAGGAAAGAEGAEMGAMGAEAAAGPVGIALAVVTGLAAAAAKAAEQLYALTNAAAQSSRQFESLKFSTGGTGQETAGLANLGRAGGLSPEAMGALSSNIQNAITSDPMARMAGLQLGISNLPRPWGNVDEAGNTMTAIQNLRAIPDHQEQIRLARQIPGLEAALPLTTLSDKQFGMVGKDAATQAQIFNPQFAEQSADFLASVGRVQQSLENLLAAVGPSAMTQMTDFFNMLADTINNTATYLSQHQGDIAKFVDFIEAIGDAVTGQSVAAVEHLNNIVSGKDDQVKALDANTQAMNKNTQALGQPGTYGKVTRDGALPGAATAWGNPHKAADVEALQLGAF